MYIYNILCRNFSQFDFNIQFCSIYMRILAGFCDKFRYKFILRIFFNFQLANRFTRKSPNVEKINKIFFGRYFQPEDPALNCCSLTIFTFLTKYSHK